MPFSDSLVVGDRSYRFDARTVPECCFWIHADAYNWDGTSVESIPDQSGLGQDLYQSNSARRFATEPAPTPFFNGRRTFLFPTTKDRWYGRTNGLNGFPFGQTPWTLFVVCSRSEPSDESGTNCPFSWHRTAAAPNGALIFTSASNVMQSFSGSTFNDTAECNPVDVPYVWVMQYNNTSIYHFRNNVPLLFSDATGSFGAPATPLLRFGTSDPGSPGVGASGNYVGNVAEVILYTRFLSPQERTYVSNQLGGYYNIPISGSWGPR